jgi:hypothetical protein
MCVFSWRLNLQATEISFDFMSSHQLCTELTNTKSNLPQNETKENNDTTAQQSNSMTTISSPRSQGDDEATVSEEENESESGETTARRRASKLVKKLKRAVSFNVCPQHTPPLLYPHYFPPGKAISLFPSGSFL